MSRFAVGLMYALLTTAIAVGCTREKPTFRARLQLHQDAFEVVNWYSPMRLALAAESDSQRYRLPAGAPLQRKVGQLHLGTGPDSVVTVILAEDADAGRFRIYIDADRDGDVTDDGDGRWAEERASHLTTRVNIPVSYAHGDSATRVDYPLTFYRFKDRLPDHLLYYRHGYRAGLISLPDTTHRIAIFDEDADGRFDDLKVVTLVIDVDGDGKLDGSLDSAELFEAEEPFNIAGTTYEVLRISPMGDEIVLTVSDTTVAPKPYIAPGHPAPEFTMKSLSGETIRLSDYRGRVVLLDFWATWCTPCVVELPNVRRTYEQYHEEGFEIIGLSLDESAERLTEFIEQHQVSWPQLFDGRGWKMEIAQLYRVSAIPATFLLDRTGTIRYKNLRGPDLGKRVKELLAEPVSD